MFGIFNTICIFSMFKFVILEVGQMQISPVVLVLAK